jgi:pyruvate/2-oxoglutarate dehydrogenase complex dihydrolipoamide acyltransferase (E2) component
MSLETKIEALTAAVNQLIAVMSAGTASVQQPAPVVQAQPAAPVAAPVPAPTMPAPPTFAPAAQVAPAPVVTGAPFTNPQELMQYVMGAYQAMGPTKGANIQGILTSLGHSNINDVKPEQYGQLYAAVEQLKAS